MRLIIQPHREESLAGGDSRASQKSQPAAGSQEARLGGLVEPWYGWNLTGHSERPRSQVHLTFLTYSFHVWWKMDLISPVGAFETGSPHKEKTKINWDIDTVVILHCVDNECGTWGGLLYHYATYSLIQWMPPLLRSPEEFKANWLTLTMQAFSLTVSNKTFLNVKPLTHKPLW